MPTITVLYPDETVEVVQTPDARSWIADNIPGVPCLVPDWQFYGDKRCQVWYGFNADQWNPDASALYVIYAGGPDLRNMSEYSLFGPVAIVQE